MIELIKSFRKFYMRERLEKYCISNEYKCCECKLHHQCGFRFSEKDLIRCYKIIFGRKKRDKTDNPSGK